mmetsp:Transcript_130575/g.325807  ORF Transcript_130575/g.325807 Transcript_130575/m.325807 type:complete len:268 (+) Transcript_130575:710-1513(+)
MAARPCRRRCREPWDCAGAATAHSRGAPRLAARALRLAGGAREVRAVLADPDILGDHLAGRVRDDPWGRDGFQHHVLPVHRHLGLHGRHDQRAAHHRRRLRRLAGRSRRGLDGLQEPPLRPNDRGSDLSDHLHPLHLLDLQLPASGRGQHHVLRRHPLRPRPPRRVAGARLHLSLHVRHHPQAQPRLGLRLGARHRLRERQHPGAADRRVAVAGHVRVPAERGEGRGHGPPHARAQRRGTRPLTPLRQHRPLHGLRAAFLFHVLHVS